MFGFLKRGEDSEGSTRGKEEAKPAKEGEKCKLCGDNFSFINLKHQCRKCGNSVCGTCSTGKMYIRGFNENQRACDDCMQEKMQLRGRTYTSPGLEKRKKKELEEKRKKELEEKKKKVLEEKRKKELEEKRKECGEAEEAVAAPGPGHKKSKMGSGDSRLVNAFKNKGWTGWEEESVKPPHLQTKMGGEPSLAAGDSSASPMKAGRGGGEKQSKVAVPGRKARTMDDKDFEGDLQQLGWQDDEMDGPGAAAPQRAQAAAPLKGSLGRLQAEIKDLKREAFALKKEGLRAEAMEALKKAKLKEAELAELQMIGGSDEDENGEEEDPELAEAMAVAERELKNRPKGDADMDPGALMKAIAEMPEDVDVSDGSDVDEGTAADLQELGLEARIRKKPGVAKKPGRKGGAVPGGEADLLSEAMRAINDDNDHVEVTEGDLADPEWASQLGELGWQHGDGEEHEHGGAPLPPPPVAPSAQHVAAPVGAPKRKSKAELEKEMKALKLKMLKLRKEKKMDEWKLEVEKLEKLQEQLDALNTPSAAAAPLPTPPPQLFKENGPSIKRPPREDANEPLPVPVPVPERAGRTSEHAAVVGDDEDDDFDKRLRALRGGQPKVVEGPAPVPVRVAPPQPPLEEVQGSTQHLPAPSAQRQGPSAQSSIKAAAATASANSGRHAEAPVVVPSAPVVSVESLEKELLVKKKQALALMKARRMDEWREAAAGIEQLQEQIEAAKARPAKPSGPSAASTTPKVGDATAGAVVDSGGGVPVVSVESLEKELLVKKKEALTLMKARRMDEWREAAAGIEQLQEQIEAAKAKPAQPSGRSAASNSAKVGDATAGAAVDSRPSRPRPQSVDSNDGGGERASKKAEIAELKRRALALKTEGKKDEALDQLRKAKILELQLEGATGGAASAPAPAPAVGGSRGGAQDLPRPSPGAGGEKQRKHLENKIRAVKLQISQLMLAGRTEEAKQGTRALRLLEQQLKSIQ